MILSFRIQCDCKAVFIRNQNARLFEMAQNDNRNAFNTERNYLDDSEAEMGQLNILNYN